MVARHTVIPDLHEEPAGEDLAETSRGFDRRRQVPGFGRSGHRSPTAPGEGNEVADPRRLGQILVRVDRPVLLSPELAPGDEPTDRRVAGRVGSEQNEMIGRWNVDGLGSVHPPDPPPPGRWWR